MSGVATESNGVQGANGAVVLNWQGGVPPMMTAQAQRAAIHAEARRRLDLIMSLMGIEDDTSLQGDRLRTILHLVLSPEILDGELPQFLPCDLSENDVTVSRCREFSDGLFLRAGGAHIHVDLFDVAAALQRIIEGDDNPEDKAQELADGGKLQCEC